MFSVSAVAGRSSAGRRLQLWVVSAVSLWMLGLGGSARAEPASASRDLSGWRGGIGITFGTPSRDIADVTAVLKELHRIVNEAILTQGTGADHAEGLTVDLSKIDFEKLREEFEKNVRRKRTAVADLCQVVDQKLQQMLALNPLRMDYYKRYQEIIADYNR